MKLGPLMWIVIFAGAATLLYLGYKTKTGVRFDYPRG